MRSMTVLLLVVGLFLPAVSAQADVQYSLTVFDTFGGTLSRAYGINANGDVVGEATVSSGPSHAFLYSGGKMQDLGTNGGLGSYAMDINDNGQIVGSYKETTTTTRPFLYDQGTMTRVVDLMWDSYATAINNHGEIVGSYYYPHQDFGYFYSQGSVTKFGQWYQDSYTLADINDSGQFVGQRNSHAYLNSGGTPIDLGSLFDPSKVGGSWAVAINASGQITGSFNEKVDGVAPIHAFLYSGSEMTTIGPLDSFYTNTQSQGINAAGAVVGFTWNALSGDSHAFLYANETLIDLNTLIDPTSGWTLTTATDINNSGQIVGEAMNANGDIRGFLLTPVPEPSTFVLLAFGGTGLLGCAWRRRRST